MVGLPEGLVVGNGEGIGEGGLVGWIVGTSVGDDVGIPVGALDIVGELVGIPVGVLDGLEVGVPVGALIGLAVGDLVGAFVGAAVGVPVGAALGLTGTYLWQKSQVTGHASRTVLPPLVILKLSQYLLVLLTFAATHSQVAPVLPFLRVKVKSSSSSQHTPQV